MQYVAPAYQSFFNVLLFTVLTTVIDIGVALKERLHFIAYILQLTLYSQYFIACILKSILCTDKLRHSKFGLSSCSETLVVGIIEGCLHSAKGITILCINFKKVLSKDATTLRTTVMQTIGLRMQYNLILALCRYMGRELN